jgi:hypothetical protein
MSNDGRKHMRIALSAETAATFDDAKKKAETALKVTMSDSQYAVKLIGWALSDD